jgi:hypothetical protein
VADAREVGREVARQVVLAASKGDWRGAAQLEELVGASDEENDGYNDGLVEFVPTIPDVDYEFFLDALDKAKEAK